jgi:hypothetical protein
MTPRLMGLGPAKFGRLWQAVAGCGSFLKYFLSRIVKE